MPQASPVLILVNLAIFGAAWAFSYVLGFVFRTASLKTGFLDYPSGRKTHLKPMPCLGGAGIFTAFWSAVFGGIAFAFAAPDWVRETMPFVDSIPLLYKQIVGIFAGSLIIFAVGLYDDRYGWTPLQKLVGQAAAAIVLLRLGFTISLFSGFEPLGWIVTFCWILLIINAFNFIDSLDGHCTGVALISTVIFFWLVQIIDQPMVALFLIAFAGALLGFLPHNFKPARAFLGDNGSMFIGYMLAAITLLCQYQAGETNYVTLFIPVLMFGVPIYDTLSVIAVRLSRGIAPWRGDRNHFAHRLVKMGMSERVAVVFSYFIAFTLGQVSLLTTQVDFFGAVIIAIIFLSVIGVIAFLEYYAVESARLAQKLLERRSRHRRMKRPGQP